MLSLVLIVVVVANVVLWSYQMNQLDWEKMREDISIANVTRVEESWSYNPSECIPGGSASRVSGSISDLTTDDGIYMVFRSYATATGGQTLYAHQETTTIGGTTYRLQKLDSADTAEIFISVSGASVSRKLVDKFVYPLTGISSIPASTWTIYYRAIKSSPAIEAQCNVDILIRQVNGTIRTTIATNVANSSELTTAWTTLSGTYTWSAYSVVDQSDYLEIDYYIEVTKSSPEKTASLRIDDNTLAIADQTRATNIMLPSEFTVEVEFTWSSNTESWTQLVWIVDSSWTMDNVTVTIQLYNYTLNDYPTSGNGYIAYTSSSISNTDETRNQTITVNPTDFRNATGYWRIKVKGVKATNTQFDFKVDWVELKVFCKGTLFTFKNNGPITSPLVSLWVINSTHHLRYNIDVIINSGETLPYLRVDVNLPAGQWMIKVVTERGNIATFQENTM
jgi:hypothetical protein